jgi:hypothetical protein
MMSILPSPNPRSELDTGRLERFSSCHPTRGHRNIRVSKTPTCFSRVEILPIFTFAWRLSVPRGGIVPNPRKTGLFWVFEPYIAIRRNPHSGSHPSSDWRRFVPRTAVDVLPGGEEIGLCLND